MNRRRMVTKEMKKMALFMAGLMVLVAFSASVSAFAAAPAPTLGTTFAPAAPQQQSADPGSISGRVTRLVVGTPIANATVYYGGIGVEEGKIEFAYGSVKTDENGHYSIGDLNKGIYGLFVTKAGHIPNGRIVHLEQGENKNSVDFNLIKIK